MVILKFDSLNIYKNRPLALNQVELFHRILMWARELVNLTPTIESALLTVTRLSNQLSELRYLSSQIREPKSALHRSLVSGGNFKRR